MITSNPLFKLMKKTINNITTDNLEKEQVCIGAGKICKMQTMEDGYLDDIEIRGTTLLEEKDEGAPMATDDIGVGGTKRYWARTMAKKVPITEEALEDNKYKDTLKLSQRLVKSAYVTQDIDVSTILSRCTADTGGYDGVVLASTSHVLPGGATASNYLLAGVGCTPSTQALMWARNMATLMPGPNGLISSLSLKSLWFPDIQLDKWKVITGTEKSPGNEYNDINTVASYGLKLIPIKWLDATNQNIWGCLTDAEDGIQAFQRRKITSTTWVDNDGMVMFHGVHYRMAMGWSNWRHLILGMI